MYINNLFAFILIILITVVKLILRKLDCPVFPSRVSLSLYFHTRLVPILYLDMVRWHADFYLLLTCRITFRFTQSFTFENVTENYILLQIVTTGTFTCGSTNLVYSRGNGITPCNGNKHAMEICEIVDKLPLDNACYIKCRCVQKCDKLIMITARNNEQSWSLCDFRLA